MFKLVGRPSWRLVFMTGVAGVGNAELFSQLWRDEGESVTAYKLAFDGDFNLRHVTGCALASCTLGRMMRVCGD